VEAKNLIEKYKKFAKEGQQHFVVGDPYTSIFYVRYYEDESGELIKEREPCCKVFEDLSPFIGSTPEDLKDPLLLAYVELYEPLDIKITKSITQ